MRLAQSSRRTIASLSTLSEYSYNNVLFAPRQVEPAQGKGPRYIVRPLSEVNSATTTRTDSSRIVPRPMQVDPIDTTVNVYAYSVHYPEQ